MKCPFCQNVISDRERWCPYCHNALYTDGNDQDATMPMYGQQDPGQYGNTGYPPNGYWQENPYQQQEWDQQGWGQPGPQPGWDQSGPQPGWDQSGRQWQGQTSYGAYPPPGKRRNSGKVLLVMILSTVCTLLLIGLMVLLLSMRRSDDSDSSAGSSQSGNGNGDGAVVIISEKTDDSTKKKEEETSAAQTGSQETNQPVKETQAPQTETRPPQTETQPAQKETQPPQTETQPPQTETQAPAKEIRHAYEFIPGDFSWTGASSDAANRGGYLAIITSADEEYEVERLMQNYDSFHTAWLGAYRTGGTFRWTNGEALTYTKWMSGEPNNETGDEDYLDMLRIDGVWYWNDVPNEIASYYPGRIGYILEREIEVEAGAAH